MLEYDDLAMVATSLAELSVDTLVKYAPQLKDAGKSKEALSKVLLDQIQAWENGVLGRVAKTCAAAQSCPACPAPSCPSCPAIPNFPVCAPPQPPPSWFDKVPYAFCLLAAILVAVLIVLLMGNGKQPHRK